MPRVDMAICWIAQRACTGWRAAAAELEELERSEQEKLRLLDLWQFQRKEIESANLGTEEDAALENERRVLQNVQRLEEAAGAATARCTRAKIPRCG